MTVHLFDSSGDFVAFRRTHDDRYLFDVDGNWIGWFPWGDADVVTEDGDYLGTVVGNRLLRREPSHIGVTQAIRAIPATRAIPGTRDTPATSRPRADSTTYPRACSRASSCSALTVECVLPPRTTPAQSVIDRFVSQLLPPTRRTWNREVLLDERPRMRSGHQLISLVSPGGSPLRDAHSRA